MFSSLLVSIFTVFPAEIIASLFKVSLLFPPSFPSIIILFPAITFAYSVSLSDLNFSFNGISWILADPVFSVNVPLFPK